MPKEFYDCTGQLIIHPYRLKDIAAIYNVSRHTIRRWINQQAPEYGNKTRKFFTKEQVTGIVLALGKPERICTIIPLQSFKQAV